MSDLPAPPPGPQAFDAGPAMVQALEATPGHGAGDGVFARWNPPGGPALYRPGMKVMFFGRAAGCRGGGGPAGPVPADEAAPALARTGAAVPPARAPARERTPEPVRWRPQADPATCGTALHRRSGPSLVQWTPGAEGGTLALYTDAGMDPMGEPPFLAPFDAAGQGGHGTNAGIVGTFVAFRQAWPADTAVRPWPTRQAVAQVRAVQALGGAVAGDARHPDAPVQVKQQLMATFLDTRCAAAGTDRDHPCQLQYVFNTAVVRTGVDDWRRVGWFAQGGLFLDPAQGGMPIVNGPVHARGEPTLDAASRLPLFRSEGTATQHQAGAEQPVDLRIAFDELLNAVRLATAIARHAPAGPASPDDVHAMWRDGWDDPASWILLSVDVGQEVWAPKPVHDAWIGGTVRGLHVGTAFSARNVP